MVMEIGTRRLAEMTRPSSGFAEASDEW